MQKTFSTIALLLLALVAHSADFRGASWLMSPAQVKRTETEKLVQEDTHSLTYETLIAGKPVRILYRFDSQSRLHMARYQFVRQYRDSSRYNDNYELLQSQLQAKYGQPLASQVICEDDFYTGYPGRWGTGIVVGRLSRQAVWQTDSLILRHIIHSLPGGGVGHYVEYRPGRPTDPTLQSIAAELYSAL